VKNVGCVGCLPDDVLGAEKKCKVNYWIDPLKLSRNYSDSFQTLISMLV